MSEIPLKVNDFVSIALKARDLEHELKKETNEQQKTKQEINQAVMKRVAELIKYIAHEDILGEARYNKITEDMRPQCPLPHQPLKIDLPVVGLITRSLLEKDQTSGIYKNLNQAKDQMVSLLKEGSIGSRKQFETVVALLNQ